jgi:hypothetical protein
MLRTGCEKPVHKTEEEGLTVTVQENQGLFSQRKPKHAHVFPGKKNV